MTTKPGFVVFILLSTFSTYYAGIQMGKTESQSKRKQFLLLSLLFNLGLLFLLKYYNFFNDSAKVLFAHFHSVYKIPAFHVLLPAPIFRNPSPSFGEGGTFAYSADPGQLFRLKAATCSDPWRPPGRSEATLGLHDILPMN